MLITTAKKREKEKERGEAKASQLHSYYMAYILHIRASLNPAQTKNRELQRGKKRKKRKKERGREKKLGSAAFLDSFLPQQEEK